MRCHPAPPQTTHSCEAQPVAAAHITFLFFILNQGMFADFRQAPCMVTFLLSLFKHFWKFTSLCLVLCCNMTAVSPRVEGGGWRQGGADAGERRAASPCQQHRAAGQPRLQRGVTVLSIVYIWAET